MAAQEQDPAESAACPSSFFFRVGLLYRHSRRGDRLCVPVTAALFAQAVCTSSTPICPAGVEEYMSICPTCQHVKTGYLPSAGLLFPLSFPTHSGGCIRLDFTVST